MYTFGKSIQNNAYFSKRNAFLCKKKYILRKAHYKIYMNICTDFFKKALICSYYIFTAWPPISQSMTLSGTQTTIKQFLRNSQCTKN